MLPGVLAAHLTSSRGQQILRGWPQMPPGGAACGQSSHRPEGHLAGVGSKAISCISTFVVL